MSKTSPFHNMNRRQRIITVTSAVVLLILCVTILTTPRLKQFVSGPSATEVALQREQARASDLKRQIELLNAELAEPRPVATDKLLAAKAADLKKQLDAAEARLRKGRPPVMDAEQQARADDLARQNAILSAKLKAPRYVPPIVVKADRNKAQILKARKLFGLYTAQSPFQYAEFNLVQDQVARNADISGYFQSWRDPYRPDAIKAAWHRGDIPLLTWESMEQIGVIDKKSNAKYSLPKIINGQFDAYLTQYARGITSTGLPVIIRLDHEMNGNWYPWSELTSNGKSINGNRRGDYVKMWRHVHDIFQREGANQYAMWLWSPNRINQIPRMPAPKAFYPGDKYVDLIGMSGYYRPYDGKPTFANSHERTLPLLRQATRNKPIILSEIGATEDKDKKSLWINDMFTQLQKPVNSDIIGFVWFNFAVTSKGNTNDWRINSTPRTSKTVSANLWKYGYGTPRGKKPSFPAPTTSPTPQAAVTPVVTSAPADAPTPTPFSVIPSGPPAILNSSVPVASGLVDASTTSASTSPASPTMEGTEHDDPRQPDDHAD